MKKLAYSLAFTCLLTGSGANAELLNMTGPSLFFQDKAVVTRTEDANTITFRFSATSIPDKATLEAAMNRYRNIPGFQNLQVGQDNIVVLTTDKTVSEEHLQKLLLSSTRLYGHIGFEIKS